MTDHVTDHVTQSTGSHKLLVYRCTCVRMYNTGTIRYIGKLDFDILDLIYIGVHLDMPIGTCDGSVKGRRYFQCPPNHGVFVRPSDVMCVTGRKVRKRRVQASLYT